MAEPWMKFYPTDWRSDPRLRMCGMAARGLWIEMIALMHEAAPYGHLLVSGRSPTDAQLAVLAGAPPDQVPELIGELESAGVFSRTKEGVIYSRKMTRAAKKAALDRKAGNRGGNPKLKEEYRKEGYLYIMGTRGDGACKVGVSVSPQNRLKKIRAQYRNDDISILETFPTSDMGTLEATVHRTLGQNQGGEWFLLSPQDLQTIREIADPKGSGKGSPFPQKPEARSQKEKIEPKAQRLETPRAAPEQSVYDRLIAAASIRGPCHERLAFGFSPIADLIGKGYDLDRDILPVIRDRAGPERRSWDYFVPIIIEAAAKRAAVPEAPRAPEFDWRRALEVFREGTWAAGWGPKPGERGCRVPMPLLAEFGFERAA